MTLFFRKIKRLKEVAERGMGSHSFYKIISKEMLHLKSFNLVCWSNNDFGTPSSFSVLGPLFLTTLNVCSTLSLFRQICSCIENKYLIVYVTPIHSMQRNICINQQDPIGSWTCNFPPFRKTVTDQPTNRPSDRPTGGYEGSKVSYTYNKGCTDILSSAFMIKFCGQDAF